MRRFELPADLTREEELAILSALERYFRREGELAAPWALAGRVEAAGLGALQTRRMVETPWLGPSRLAFARPGVPPLHGRGDAR